MAVIFEPFSSFLDLDVEYWDGLRYRGGHIPSRIFWILDESGIKNIFNGGGERVCFVVSPMGYGGTKSSLVRTNLLPLVLKTPNKTAIDLEA